MAKNTKTTKVTKTMNVQKAPTVKKVMKTQTVLAAPAVTKTTGSSESTRAVDSMNVPEEKVSNTMNEESPVNIEDMIVNLLNEQTDITRLHKIHTNKIKSFLKLYKRERKIMVKKTKKIRDPSLPKRPNAFTTPTKISDKLCTFLHKPKGTLVARTDVTKAISKYIKSNNLSVPENKKQFIPDASLKHILAPLQEKDLEKGYTYFNLQRYIRDEFIKTTPSSNSVSMST
jgi:chromatin remodeling complex protein RSC6